MNTLTLRFATLPQRQKLQFNCDAIQQATLLLIHKAKLSTVHFKKASTLAVAEGENTNSAREWMHLVTKQTCWNWGWCHWRADIGSPSVTGMKKISVNTQQGSCRNYMSKNTFCCGDKIPILVHTCGSTERNYAFFILPLKLIQTNRRRTRNISKHVFILL